MAHPFSVVDIGIISFSWCDEKLAFGIKIVLQPVQYLLTQYSFPT